jgi:hypothetical protein
MVVTLFYASLLALWGLVLAVQVIRGRRAYGVSLGDGGNPRLERRARAFGNFCEYVPPVLIVMALLESADAPVLALHIIGVLLTVGRLVHGIALGFGAHWSLGRIGGMILTLSSLGVAGLIGLAVSLGLA